MLRYRFLALSFIALLILPLVRPTTASATFNGDNGQVLYTKWSPTTQGSDYRQADGTIYIANEDGSNERAFGQSTDYPELHVSPDGSHIVYRLTHQDDSNLSDVIVSNIDGSNKQIVYSGYFLRNVDFLDSGSALSFEICPAGGCNGTFKINLDGSDLHRFTTDSYGTPSPDGTQYAETTSDSSGADSIITYVSGLDGSNVDKQPTTLYTIHNRCTTYCMSTPVWSSDNTRVAFWKYVDINTSALVILNTHTGQSSEYPYSGRYGSLIWSPNSQELLFTADSSSTLPYYGYPYDPAMGSFNLASHSFTGLSFNRPHDIVDWQALGNPNTTTVTTPVVPTAPAPTITLSNIYRFYSPLIQHHLFTADSNEYNSILAHFPPSVWASEGVAFKVNGTANCSAGRSVYRFYSELLKTHLYTMDENEKATLIAKYPPSIWHYEGIAFCADTQQVAGTKPVYRFYSERFKTHLYTMDENEKNSIMAHYSSAVYRYEGIAYYAYPS